MHTSRPILGILAGLALRHEIPLGVEFQVPVVRRRIVVVAEVDRLIGPHHEIAMDLRIVGGSDSPFLIQLHARAHEETGILDFLRQALPSRSIMQ